MVGDSGVGKTSILRQLTEDSFDPLFQSTIGIDFRIRTMMLDGKLIKLQIWDTAGQERFKGVVASYYRGAHAVMLTYDITDRLSFEHLESWLTEVDRNADERVRVILVGNKLDMEHKREVTKEMIESFRIQFASGRANMLEDGNSRLISYEVSAKTGAKVSEAFVEMVRSLQRSPNGPPPQRRRPGVNIQTGSTVRMSRSEDGWACVC